MFCLFFLFVSFYSSILIIFLIFYFYFALLLFCDYLGLFLKNGPKLTTSSKTRHFGHSSAFLLFNIHAHMHPYA